MELDPQALEAHDISSRINLATFIPKPAQTKMRLPERKDDEREDH